MTERQKKRILTEFKGPGWFYWRAYSWWSPNCQFHSQRWRHLGKTPLIRFPKFSKEITWIKLIKISKILRIEITWTWLLTKMERKEQIHKYKFKYPNTKVQLHKYKCRNPNTKVQIHKKFRETRKVLSGRQSKARQSESSLAVTNSYKPSVSSSSLWSPSLSSL